MERSVRLGVAVAVFALFLSWAVAQATPANPLLLANPVKIDKGLTGLTWDGKEFIATYGISNVPIINVSIDGQKVTRFAPSFIGDAEVYAALSQGKAGFPAGYLYANSDKAVYQLDPTGANVKVFSSPPGASRISYVAFDTVGTWGFLLLALDDNGLLWSIGPDGGAKVIGNFSGFATPESAQRGGIKPEGIAVAPSSFGAYGGYLFITLEGAGRVLAIPPSDTSRVTTVALLPGEQPERVVVIPDAASDLYLAEFDTGNMLRVPAANFSSYAGSLLVITEGETEPLGTFNVLQATGSNITSTRIGAVAGHPHFEGVSFVPTGASPPVTMTTSLNTAESTTAGISSGVLLAGVAILVAVVVVAAFLFARRRSNLPR